MRRLVALGLLLAVSVGAPSYGKVDGISRIYTGNELKQMCDKSKANCVSYVTGAVDMMLLLTQIDREQKQWICFPNDVDTLQLTDIVMKNLETNPETRNRFANTIVWNALLEAFPCKNAPKP